MGLPQTTTERRAAAASAAPNGRRAVSRPRLRDGNYAGGAHGSLVVRVGGRAASHVGRGLRTTRKERGCPKHIDGAAGVRGKHGRTRRRIRGGELGAGGAAASDGGGAADGAGESDGTGGAGREGRLHARLGLAHDVAQSAQASIDALTASASDLRAQLAELRAHEDVSLTAAEMEVQWSARCQVLRLWSFGRDCALGVVCSQLWFNATLHHKPSVALADTSKTRTCTRHARHRRLWSVHRTCVNSSCLRLAA